MLKSSGLLSRFLLVEMKTKMTPLETLLVMTRTTAAPLLTRGANHVTCTMLCDRDLESRDPFRVQSAFARRCLRKVLLVLVTRAWLEERIENSKFSQGIQLNAWFKFEHSTRAIGEISLNKTAGIWKPREVEKYIFCVITLFIGNQEHWRDCI